MLLVFMHAGIEEPRDVEKVEQSEHFEKKAHDILPAGKHKRKKAQNDETRRRSKGLQKNIAHKQESLCEKCLAPVRGTSGCKLVKSRRTSSNGRTRLLEHTIYRQEWARRDTVDLVSEVCWVLHREVRRLVE